MCQNTKSNCIYSRSCNSANAWWKYTLIVQFSFESFHLRYHTILLPSCNLGIIFFSFFFIFYSSTLLFQNFVDYTHMNLGEINNNHFFFELSDAYPYPSSLSHPQVLFLSTPWILHAPSPSICTQTLNSKRSRGLVTLYNLWQGHNPGTWQLAPKKTGLAASRMTDYHLAWSLLVLFFLSIW